MSPLEWGVICIFDRWKPGFSFEFHNLGRFMCNIKLHNVLGKLQFYIFDITSMDREGLVFNVAVVMDVRNVDERMCGWQQLLWFILWQKKDKMGITSVACNNLLNLKWLAGCCITGFGYSFCGSSIFICCKTCVCCHNYVYLFYIFSLMRKL